MKSPAYLNALRAFEASARHGSFSGAASELGVTAAAVGQLVRGLEEWIGSPLFHRSASGKSRLVPTEVAARGLPDISAGLDRLSLGLERLREATASGVLTVAVSPAFAAKWMLPRIDRFQAQWPETDVRLDTGLKLVDYAAQGIDIGVRYGGGRWSGLTAEKLMDEEIFPVCSPALRDSLDLREPADLTRHTLIHDLSVDPDIGFTTWETWLRCAGVAEATVQRGLRINNSAAVLQAAAEGQGIALARSILARDDIASGRLVRLFADIAVPAALAYYVVYRSDRVLAPKAEAFRRWLFTEATGI
ncbi:transcriptional regulator GcvA [Microvirga massiliensis]|uniref:transcriptional regulator GcvA n=1 Tax=Microvirga massiliensis TaxID=1033741 RepID=UPI00062B6BCF|nr:transcriptional regulator GcvA [Microvirga massiliensis]